jgi:hypothetical protein
MAEDSVFNSWSGKDIFLFSVAFELTLGSIQPAFECVLGGSLLLLVGYVTGAWGLTTHIHLGLGLYLHFSIHLHGTQGEADLFYLIRNMIILLM